MKTTGILLIFCLLALGGLYIFSRKLLYFPAPLDRGRQDFIRKTFDQVQEIEVPAGNRETLHGWILEKDMEHLPVVFYFGGNAEEVSLNLEDFHEKLNANVILVNYRGYGMSTGRPSEDALKKDALAVYDAMAARYHFDPSKTLAWGRSLGSSAACYLAEKRNLSGLILTCPFDSIENVAAVHYPAFLVRLVLRDPHRTTQFSSRIRSQTLILTAGRDEIIPRENTQRLYDSLTCPKENVIIRQAGHNTISEFEDYFKAVDQFLTRLFPEKDL